MRQITLDFAHPRGKLTGILSLPEDLVVKHIAILIGGSGPVGRDGLVSAVRQDGIPGPFVKWASELVALGIGCFRYDKRACAYADDYRRADRIATGLHEEYLDDLADALAVLKAIHELEHAIRILVGHSLGGIAALTYAMRDPSISGVATIGAPVEDLASTLKRQVAEQLGAARVGYLLHELDTALAGENEGGLGVPSAYWRDYSQYTLRRLIASMPPNLPVLLLHGREDTLIPVVHFESFMHSLPSSLVLQGKVVRGDHFLMIRRPERRGDSGDFQLDELLDWIQGIQ